MGVRFPSWPDAPPVVYVAGNHEYYDAHLGLLAELRKPEWKEWGINFLERETLILPGLRILGCTLWSDFDLYGSDKANTAMARAKHDINDYWLIHTHGGRRLMPVDTWKLHRKSVRWLDDALATPLDGKTVVVTHFAPHRRCVAPQHEGGDLTPYFVTDLAWLMKKHRIDVWCYGHTHTSTDFMAENGCRVVSNQLGLWGESNTGFRPDLVIDAYSDQKHPRFRFKTARRSDWSPPPPAGAPAILSALKPFRRESINRFGDEPASVKPPQPVG